LCVVLIDVTSRYVETRFPDGTRVGSTPNTDRHSLQMATSLGYGNDTFAMSRDHEVAHTWLAHCAGLPWSRTMWRLAHPYGDDLPDDSEVAEEEAMVLRFQRRLDKSEPRPWDLAGVPVKRPLEW
jgi:hypothetical protein